MKLKNIENTTSRRVFIKGLGFISLGVLLGTSLGGCEQISERIRNRPIRRRIRQGEPLVDADMAVYEEAVRLMKALQISDPGNPINWLNQAQIHGNNNRFIHCQHGTQHFFSWHRAYLYYFEKICQKLTGNSNWGLPYWNWNQSASLHPNFLDNSRSLYERRNRTDLTGLGAISDQTLNLIFSDRNFFSFYSQIEGTPHNTVHSRIGRTMGHYNSPIDPVFWVHHNMIDYCWAKWNLELGNDNPNAQAWLGEEWSHFVDEDGNQVSVTAGATTLMPLLGYQYETSNIGNLVRRIDSKMKEDYSMLKERVEKGANVQFRVKERFMISEVDSISIAQPLTKAAGFQASQLARILENNDKEEFIFASVEYAQVPASSDFFVRVFVNMPEANSQTSTEDRHYAGSFAFFGPPGQGDHASEGGHHEHKKSFLVNITQTIALLKQQGDIDSSSDLSIQLVAVPFMDSFEKPDTQMLLKQIEVIITPVIINE